MMTTKSCRYRGIVSSLNKSRGYRMRSNGAAAKKHVLNDREGGREGEGRERARLAAYALKSDTKGAKGRDGGEGVRGGGRKTLA